MNQNPGIQNLLTENELCELLGVKRETISVYRNEQGLPFLKVSNTRRLYLEEDVIEWLLARRVKIAGN